jgi:multiple sugar transport system substrate-binding protein
MQRNKKFGSALVAASMSLVLLAACAQQPAAPVAQQAPAQTPNAATQAPQAQPVAPTAEVIHLTFWNENADPTRTPILEDIVDRFNASQDRIFVEHVGIPQADAMDRYNVAIAGRQTPDIGGLQENWLSSFIIREAIIPLDSFFDGWSDGPHMLPSAIDSVRSNAPDGLLYMLPTSVNTQTIWIRSDWLRENNLDVPHTWDDFFSVVETTTDISQNRYGHTIRGGSGGGQALIQKIFAFSGEPVFLADGTTTLNNPHNVEFVQRYLDLYGDYTPEADITAGWTEISANFGMGIAGTLIHNLGSYQNHVDNFDSYDMFEALPPPVSRDGNRNLSTASIGYMIFRDSPHQEAAWEFLEFMLNAENNSIWNRTIGQIPTNLRVMDEDWVTGFQHISTMMEALADPATTSMDLPIFLPDFATIASRVGEPGMQQVMAGQMAAQQMLDEWAEALEIAYADYVANVLN